MLGLFYFNYPKPRHEQGASRLLAYYFIEHAFG